MDFSQSKISSYWPIKLFSVLPYPVDNSNYSFKSSFFYQQGVFNIYLYLQECNNRIVDHECDDRILEK